MQRREMIRRSFTGSVILVACLGVGTISGCGGAEHRARLDGIVRDQVSEHQLPSRLQMTFQVRQRGTKSWDDMQEFLAREPQTDLIPLREAVKKYPRILYHTTMWEITWLFVDEQGIVRGYYLSSQ